MYTGDTVRMLCGTEIFRFVEIREIIPHLNKEAYLNTLSRYHSLSDTVIIRNGKFVFMKHQHSRYDHQDKGVK